MKEKRKNVPLKENTCFPNHRTKLTLDQITHR